MSLAIRPGMHTPTRSFLLVTLLAAGCSSGGSDASPPDDDDDPVVTADAAPPAADASSTDPPPPPPDAAPYACRIEDSYGDVGAAAGAQAFADQDMEGNAIVTLVTSLPGAPEDVVAVVQLWEGFGAFADTTLAEVQTPLTIEITGDEASLETCGACVLIADDSTMPSQVFAATSGTLTITALDPTAGTGTFAGSIADVSYTHIDGNFMPVGDGCDSEITAMSFEAGIEAGM